VPRCHGRYRLSLCDYVIQPSSFWSRSAWTLTGPLNEDMHFAFDWDWFIRAQQAGVNFIPVEEYLSLYRIHAQHKSGNGGNKRVEELKTIVSTYNDHRLAQAFNKWMKIYGKDNFVSKSIDGSERFDLNFLNTLFRLSLFPSLDRNEFQSIVAMK